MVRRLRREMSAVDHCEERNRRRRARRETMECVECSAAEAQRLHGEWTRKPAGHSARSRPVMDSEPCSSMASRFIRVLTLLIKSCIY